MTLCILSERAKQGGKATIDKGKAESPNMPSERDDLANKHPSDKA